MNYRIASLVCAIISFCCANALAQQDETSPSPSTLESLLFSVVPILLIGGLVWWFFGRAVRTSQKRTDDYVARQEQHNQRVEQLLERIAKAVERKDGDAP